MKTLLMGSISFVLLCVCLPAFSAEEKVELKPQTTCPVMGGEVNKNLFVDHNGKRIYVCCGGCVNEVKKEPAKYVTKLAKAGQKVAYIPDYTKGGVNFINFDTLKKLQANKIPPLVIDVLSKSSYDKAHVDGAINIPLSELSEKAGKLDKNRKIVVYCANYNCHASTAAAKMLTKLGFKDVYDYKGGIKEWLAATGGKTAMLCSKCGEVKGSVSCCKPKGKKCGVIKGSPECLEKKKATAKKALCGKCDELKGSVKCCAAKGNCTGGKCLK